MVAKVIAFAQHKGGTGKTTTALNVGAALAELGFKTCVADLDPQADLTAGLYPDDESQPGAISLFTILSDDRGTFREIVRETAWPNLFIIPGTLDMADIELDLAGQMGRERILDGALGDIRDQYDFILLDCPPSLGLLTVNALVAADTVIVPVQAHPRAVKATFRMVSAVDKVKRKLKKPELSILGFVLTMVQNNVNVCAEACQTLVSIYGDQVFSTLLHHRAKMAEDTLYSAPIFAYAPKSDSVAELRALTYEILVRLKMEVPVHA